MDLIFENVIFILITVVILIFLYDIIFGDDEKVKKVFGNGTTKAKA
jgi:hypothetical protein